MMIIIKVKWRWLDDECMDFGAKLTCRGQFFAISDRIEFLSTVFTSTILLWFFLDKEKNYAERTKL